MSATKQYKNGERGQPCLTHLVSVIDLDVCALFVTRQLTSL